MKLSTHHPGDSLTIRFTVRVPTNYKNELYFTTFAEKQSLNTEYTYCHCANVPVGASHSSSKPLILRNALRLVCVICIIITHYNTISCACANVEMQKLNILLSLSKFEHTDNFHCIMPTKLMTDNLPFGSRSVRIFMDNW